MQHGSLIQLVGDPCGDDVNVGEPCCGKPFDDQYWSVTIVINVGYGYKYQQQYTPLVHHRNRWFFLSKIVIPSFHVS